MEGWPSCPYGSDSGALPDAMNSFLNNDKTYDSPHSSDPLEDMNVLLQHNYETTKRHLLKEMINENPLIIMDTKNMLLWHHNSYQNYSVLSQTFIDLKLVSHVALGTFTLLKDAIAQNRVTEECAVSIEQYLAYFRDALKDLPSRSLTQEQVQIAREILTKSQQILESSLASRSISEKDLMEYISPLSDPLSQFLDDAAQEQLSLAEAIIEEFRGNLTKEEWDSTRAVVLGSHMAREGNLFMQFFEKLLVSHGEGKRVVYAEGVDLAHALDLLATYLIDFSVGEAFWNNPESMRRDLLANATKNYLLK